MLKAIPSAEPWIWGCHFDKFEGTRDVENFDSSPLIIHIMGSEMLSEFKYVLGCTVFPC